MDKIYVKSLYTRKIYQMSESEYLAMQSSGEFIPGPYVEMYLHATLPGMKWQLTQAVHFLAMEDPDDHHWKPNSCHNLSLEFKKILRILKREILQDNLAYETFMGEITAENVCFINLALKNKVNIPEVFKELASVHPPVKQQKIELNPIIPLNDEAMSTYKTGVKVKKSLSKAGQVGARVNKQKAAAVWDPLLNEAMGLASKKEKYYSGNSLAVIIKNKKHSLSINVNTFTKKILADSRIRPLLKTIRSK